MMDIAAINECFDLVSITVSAKQLFLDPNNPRLNTGRNSHTRYSNEEIVSDTVQRDVTQRILASEHKLGVLITSIETQGFLSGTGAFIVEKMPGTKDRYLVLEGNRRTAAIKSLAQKADQLPKNVRTSLERIVVNEFRYRQGSPIPRDDVVDIYLGTIHISGQLEWGALEKVLYIYRSYIRDLKWDSTKPFSIDEMLLTRLAKKFSTDKSSIRKAIWVSRVYEQLLEGEYPIEPKKFSLLELCLGDRQLREEIFGMSISGELSTEGLERFHRLILSEEAPIKNPDHFKMFKFVMQNGLRENLDKLLMGSVGLEQVYDAVRDAHKETKILNQLVDVRDRLRALNISGFSADENEESVLLDIHNIVVNKLLVLVRPPSRESVDLSIMTAAAVNRKLNSVSELLSLGPLEIQALIKSSMKTFPNRSCVKTQLGERVLRHIKLRTAGVPRKAALEAISRNLEEMISSGLVQDYMAGNKRVRLLVD
jgi:hypothetical protein